MVGCGEREGQELCNGVRRRGGAELLMSGRKSERERERRRREGETREEQKEKAISRGSDGEARSGTRAKRGSTNKDGSGFVFVGAFNSLDTQKHSEMQLRERSEIDFWLRKRLLRRHAERAVEDGTGTGVLGREDRKQGETGVQVGCATLGGEGYRDCTHTSRGESTAVRGAENSGSAAGRHRRVQQWMLAGACCFAPRSSLSVCACSDSPLLRLFVAAWSLLLRASASRNRFKFASLRAVLLVCIRAVPPSPPALDSRGTLREGEREKSRAQGRAPPILIASARPVRVFRTQIDASRLTT